MLFCETSALAKDKRWSETLVVYSSFSARFRSHKTKTLALMEKIKTTLPECYTEKEPPQTLSLPKQAVTDVFEQDLKWKRVF